MVFDWFKRGAVPSEPATSPPPSPPDSLPTTDSPAPQAAESATPVDPTTALPAEIVVSAATPAAAPAEVESPAAPPAVAGVDEDALAWARQAYARLKAQQETAAQASGSPAPAVEAVPSLAVSKSEVPPDQAVPAAGADSSQGTERLSSPVQPEPSPSPEEPTIAAIEPFGSASLAAPASDPTPAVAPAAAVPAPQPAAPEAAAPPSGGLSLLELAAAQREQRRQEILAASPVPSAEPAPASTPAAPAPAVDRDEPSLGAFDADFTWSAEVLAAQGRRVEDVSLEEIDWLTRLRRGLEKTRKGFVAQLLDTLGDDPLSAASLEDIESTLLRADVGVQATDRVLEALRQRLNEEVVDPAEGLRFLKEQLRGILEEPITASGRGLLAPEKDRLNVWLLVGVNGVGKTTTLGKLANLAVRSGYSCLIAAADTFRAAAVQQVSVWGERSGVPVVSNPSANADPAAVVYDAIGAARAKGTELVLVDTAGRLQTKHNLMEELSKVRRIVDKLAPEAVVESLLVLDASQGQNGLRQAMAFASAAGLTGVVLTKLDGSARGGVALAVASEAALPIRFIGAGETIRDLRPFNSFEFVEALLGAN
jgi:fused signal recognition particle receptor